LRLNHRNAFDQVILQFDTPRMKARE
jgi:hypothetical protein